MTGRLATALLLLVLQVSFVAAQGTPSGGGDFCATAPQELLTALDGSWNLTQGPGMAITGGPSVPLPAHPPVRMALEYNSEGGYAILSGQGQQMLMLPTATETASTLLGELNQNFATSTEGMDACDWYALPTLVGTNVYDLSGFVSSQTTQAYINQTTVMAIFCYGGNYHVYQIGEDGYAQSVVYADDDGIVFADAEGDHYDYCNSGEWVHGGDMTMTIALKFDSPSSARGMLSFRGEQGGYQFAAWAPITMSR